MRSRRLAPQLTLMALGILSKRFIPGNLRHANHFQNYIRYINMSNSGICWILFAWKGSIVVAAGSSTDLILMTKGSDMNACLSSFWPDLIWHLWKKGLTEIWKEDTQCRCRTGSNKCSLYCWRLLAKKTQVLFNLSSCIITRVVEMSAALI